MEETSSFLKNLREKKILYFSWLITDNKLNLVPVSKTIKIFWRLKLKSLIPLR